MPGVWCLISYVCCLMSNICCLLFAGCCLMSAVKCITTQFTEFLLYTVYEHWYGAISLSVPIASHFVTPDMCQPGRAVEASVGRTEFLRAQKVCSSNAGLDSAARLASLAGGACTFLVLQNVMLLVLIMKWHHINDNVHYIVEIP